MNKFVSTSIAATLAAAFALAAPVFGQNKNTPAASPDKASQQQFEDLKSRLAKAEKQYEVRKAEIIKALKKENPALSPAELEKKAVQKLTEEHSRKVRNTQKGASHIDLPDFFYKAVRGCTTDGNIYRITYNLTVNFDELAAAPGPQTPAHAKSLLHRTVQPNPDSILGVSGTDRFVETLKNMTGEIHDAMQVIAGRVIDESKAEALNKPNFNHTFEPKIKEITDSIYARYGVTVSVRTSPPKQQAGRCEPAEPPTELLPQAKP